MAKLPIGERKYQIKELWEIHHEIIRRLLLGQKAKDIAQELGVTITVVSYTKNSALGRRHMELLRGAVDKETVDVKVKIQEMAARASEVLEEAMNGDHHFSLKLKAATEVLDRAGFVKVVKTENLHAYLSAEDIQQIKERAMLEGVVVDAQFEEAM